MTDTLGVVGVGQTTNTQGSPVSASAAAASRTTFPDPLKQYVARTFEDVEPEDKKDVEAELKRIITDAFNEKVVWSIDWDNMPLPQSIMAKRRAAEKQEKAAAKKANGGITRFAVSDKKRKRLVASRLSLTSTCGGDILTVGIVRAMNPPPRQRYGINAFVRTLMPTIN